MTICELTLAETKANLEFEQSRGTSTRFCIAMEPIPTPIADNNRHEISMDGIASLLAMARQRINEGNPSLALQAVVIALRASGGERAVLQAFSRARELYHSERAVNDPVDELSALFADCGLTDIQSINFGTNGRAPAANGVPSGIQEVDMMDGNIPRVQISAPILAESGRLHVVMDASSDGSSFVCLQCGGLVSNLRRDEHIQFWCSNTSR